MHYGNFRATGAGARRAGNCRSHRALESDLRAAHRFLRDEGREGNLTCGVRQGWRERQPKKVSAVASGKSGGRRHHRHSLGTGLGGFPDDIRGAVERIFAIGGPPVARCEGSGEYKSRRNSSVGHLRQTGAPLRNCDLQVAVLGRGIVAAGQNMVGSLRPHQPGGQRRPAEVIAPTCGGNAESDTDRDPERLAFHGGRANLARMCPVHERQRVAWTKRAGRHGGAEVNPNLALAQHSEIARHGGGRRCITAQGDDGSLGNLHRAASDGEAEPSAQCRDH